MPKLSIAMSAYNCEKTVGLAIRSILRQTYSDWELILIDDGSRDLTGDICASFNDPRIRFIRDGENRGLTYRLNQAIDLARGEFFGRMDADDISFPERFLLQVGYLQSHMDADLVGAKMLLIDGNSTPVGFQSCPASHSDISSAPWRVIPVWHPTWCGRTSWFKSHRYDVSAGRIEDQDLLRRAMPTSTYANLPEFLLAYRQVDLLSPNAYRSRRSYAKGLLKCAFQGQGVRYFIFGIAYALASIPAIYRMRHFSKSKKNRLPDAKMLEKWREIVGLVELKN